MKVTDTLHVLPGASVPQSVLLMTKSELLDPVNQMPAMFNAEVPGLEIIMDCGLLAAPRV